MHYGGVIEYLFVLESKDDPASAAIDMLLKDTMSTRRSARQVYAGQTTSTSQKIHK